MNNIYKDASEELITELKTQLKSLQIEYNDDFTDEEMKVMTDNYSKLIMNQ